MFRGLKSVQRGVPHPRFQFPPASGVSAVANRSSPGNTGPIEVTKEREFRCPICGARCTAGIQGTEYGHYAGCPRRPSHLPKSTCNYFDPDEGEVVR